MPAVRFLRTIESAGIKRERAKDRDNQTALAGQSPGIADRDSMPPLRFLAKLRILYGDFSGCDERWRSVFQLLPAGGPSTQFCLFAS